MKKNKDIPLCTCGHFACLRTIWSVSCIQKQRLGAGPLIFRINLKVCSGSGLYKSLSWICKNKICETHRSQPDVLMAPVVPPPSLLFQPANGHCEGSARINEESPDFGYKPKK